MEMPKPTPGHKKLELFVGNWGGEETLYPSQWDPEGGTALGSVKSRIDLDGFVLIRDYRQERGGRPTYAGHGVISYDSKADSYTLHWFDSMGSPPEVFEGSLDGSVLTFSHGGPGIHARITDDLSDPDCLVSKMELSSDGENWSTFYDARYRRV